MKRKFSWHSEFGIAVCDLILKNGEILSGSAVCHDEDEDVKSEYVGCDLASLRADLEHLYYLRDRELKPGLKALKQCYYSMNQSKKFNPSSYEAIMLKRQINLQEERLKDCREAIQEYKEHIKSYLVQIEKKSKALRKVKSRKGI